MLAMADVADIVAADELSRSFVITNPQLPDNPVCFISREFTEQTGYSVAEASGRNCRFLQGPETSPAAVDAIRQALEAAEAITVDIRNYRRDGEPFWNRLRIRPVIKQGLLLYFIGVQNPISVDQVRPLGPRYD